MTAAVEHRLPTLDEYRRLCGAVGWEAVINFDAAAASLARSLHGVVALDGGETVGMARVVGDGSLYFYVQDVAVLPSHQGRGIGGALLAALDAWIDEAAPDRAFVGLFAAAGTEPYYRRFRYERHEALTGMFRVVSR